MNVPSLLIAAVAFSLNLQARQESSLVRIRSSVLVDTKGFAQGAVFSPDGALLAFSKENYRGAYLLRLADGEVFEASASDAAGWGMTWLDDQRLVTRPVVPRPGKARKLKGLEVFDAATLGAKMVIPLNQTNSIAIPQRLGNGRLFIMNGRKKHILESVSKNTQLRTTITRQDGWYAEGMSVTDGAVRINSPGRREILSAVWSQDGTQALVEVLGRPSLYLFKKQSRTFSVVSEAGERPCWSFTDYFVFMETMDDGHEITTGKIFVSRAGRIEKQELSLGLNVVALNPTASRDGKIAFNTIEGKVYILEVEPVQ